MWTVVECYLYTVLEQEILSCKVFLIMLGVCIMLELTSGHFTRMHPKCRQLYFCLITCVFWIRRVLSLGASSRVLPSVTGRFQVRVAVSSYCIGEGKALSLTHFPRPCTESSALGMPFTCVFWICILKFELLGYSILILCFMARIKSIFSFSAGRHELWALNFQLRGGNIHLLSPCYIVMLKYISLSSQIQPLILCCYNFEIYLDSNKESIITTHT